MMQNLDTGDIKKCQVSTADSITTGMWSTQRDINQCVQTLEQLGYTKIN